MSQLPTNRTRQNSIPEHIADHNEIHRVHNLMDDGASGVRSIAQTGHGFSVGQALRYNGTSYVLAEADSDAHAAVVGLVRSVTDADNFVLQSGGYLPGLSGLTAGRTYYLDPNTAGALTATAPTTYGYVVRAVLAASSTTAGHIVSLTGRDTKYPLNVGSLQILGHSFTVATNSSSNQVGTYYGEQTNLVATLAGMLGVDNENIVHRGISGSQLTAPITAFGANHAGWGGTLQFVMPNNSSPLVVGNASSSDTVRPWDPRSGPGVAVIVHGINDITLNPAEYAFLSTAGSNAWRNALRTIISRYRAGALWCSSSSGTMAWDSTISFSGGSDVTNVTGSTGTGGLSCSGAGYRNFTANGNTVTWTVPLDMVPGTYAFCFIAQQNAMSALAAAITDTVTTSVTMNGQSLFPQSGTFTIKIDSEEMVVTSGASTNNWTVSRGANGTTKTTHLNSATVTMGRDVHRVNWTTNGSNASITGSTYLSGQGYAGKEVSVIQRFVLTAADAGKTITATVAGLLATDTSASVKFDSVWMEAPDPTPVIVVNTPRSTGFGSATSFAQVSVMNADTAAVVAEFDSSVAIADVDTGIYNYSGVATSALGTGAGVNQTISFTANNKTKFDELMNASPFKPFKMHATSAENIWVTGIAYLSGSNYTLTCTRNYTEDTPAGGTGTNSSTGSAITYAEWYAKDDTHPNAIGHARWARIIYDTIQSLNLTPEQVSNVAGNWTQDQRVVTLVPGDLSYIWPNCAAATTAAITLQTVTWAPVFIATECTAVAIGSRITSAGTSTTLRMGIYDMDKTGQKPGNLCYDAGNTGVTSGAGNKEITGLACRLRPGWYWLAFLQTGTAAATMAVVPPNGLNLQIPSPVAPPTNTWDQITGFATTGQTVLPKSGGLTPTAIQSASAGAATSVAMVYLRVRNSNYA